MLTVILIIASLLRFYGLGKFSLWHDEAITLLSQDNLKEVFNIFTHFQSYLDRDDPATLFFYETIIYYWKKLVGIDEFRLRTLSVIFGILGVLCIYWLSNLLFDRRIGVLAAFLLAMQPLHIYYSQELRMYSLVVVSVMLSQYFLIKSLYRDKFKYWLFYVLFIVFSIYMHYVVLSLLFTNLIFFSLFFKKFRSITIHFLLANFFICILIIPLLRAILYCIFHSFNISGQSLPIYLPSVTLKNILFSLKNFSVGYSIDFFSVVGLLASAIFFIFFIYGIIRTKDLKNAAFLLCSFAAPILTIFIISKIFKPCYVDRHFLPFSSFFYIGIAHGISKFKKIGLLSVLIVVTLLASKGAIGNYKNELAQDFFQRVAAQKKKDEKKLAQFLYVNFREGDGIFHTCVNTVYPLKVYSSILPHSEKLFFFQKEINEGKVLRFDKDGRLYMFSYVGTHPIFLEEFRPIDISFFRYRRIWLIFSTWDFENDNSSYEVIKYFSSQHRAININRLGGTELFSYVAQ